MRVAVTGASGFIGSHVSAALRARGDEVVVIGRSVPPMREVDCLHHLAYDATAEDPRVNVELSVRLATAALDAGARHVVFASSGFVYGDAEALPIPETHATRPRTANGWAKLRSEDALAELCARRGASLTVLRYANVYGGGERDRSVVARLLRALRDGEPARIAGDGSQTRDFIHVDDVVAANLAAMRLAGVYNAGTGVETSILEAWEIVQEAIGRRGTIEWVPLRGDDRARNALDGEKLRKESGLPNPRSLREGVVQSVTRTAGDCFT